MQWANPVLCFLSSHTTAQSTCPCFLACSN